MTIDDFITGEKFYAAADLVYSPDTGEIDYNKQANTYDESRLSNGIMVVYLHTMYSGHFFDRIRQLPNRFVVVTHNSDSNVRDVSNVPANVVHWFSQNVCVSDSRLSSLPIGLENERWFPEVHKKKLLLHKMTARRSYRNLVYINHNISTNHGDRAAPYDLLSGKPFVTIVYGANPRDFDKYLDDLYNHKFIISPPGNGVDTHRKWEALYVGTIPIEKRCPNNTFYEDLPICFVDDWDQITEDFLNREYERIRGIAWNLEKLKMSYWLAEIARAR